MGVGLTLAPRRDFVSLVSRVNKSWVQTILSKEKRGSSPPSTKRRISERDELALD